MATDYTGTWKGSIFVLYVMQITYANMGIEKTKMGIYSTATAVA